MSFTYLGWTGRYDSRVKAFEVDMKPTEDYSDVGGLDKQIEELIEAVVRPITHKHLFVNLGIKPPKGTSRSHGQQDRLSIEV